MSDAPDAPRVARRALALAVVACRGFLEKDAANPEARDFHGRLKAWIRDTELVAELEAAELALVDAPFGALDPQAQIDATWRAEGLAVLAWSLGRELPAYDVQSDPAKVSDELGFLEAPEAFARRAWTLRSRGEIRDLADFQFALHWRLRDYGLKPQPMDFQASAGKLWFGPLRTVGMRFAKGDLEIQGSPLAEAPVEAFHTCLSIARERHLAANWLCGERALYSETDTST